MDAVGIRQSCVVAWKSPSPHQRFPMFRARLVPALVLFATACTRAPQPRESARGEGSRNGVVVSTSSVASDAGASVLAQGGDAVDAAVATAFALAVTHPSAGNIGGGGFMVVRLANGTATTIDYRERAPLASTPTMYLDEKGQIVRQRT